MNFTIQDLRDDPVLLDDVNIVPNLDLIVELKLSRVRPLPVKIVEKDQEEFLANLRKDAQSIIESVVQDDFWPLTDGALVYFYGEENYKHRMKFYSVYCVYTDIVNNAKRDSLVDLLVSACISGKLDELVETFYTRWNVKDSVHYQRFKVKYHVVLPSSPF